MNMIEINYKDNYHAAWLMFMLISAGVRSSLSCGCFEAHPQTTFCNAKYALRFRVAKVEYLVRSWDGTTKLVDANEVADEEQPPPEIAEKDGNATGGIVVRPPPEFGPWSHLRHMSDAVYTLNHVKVYKGAEYVENLNKTHARSALDDARCGTLLTQGETYYTMGSSTDDLYLTSCDFIMGVSHMTGEQHRLLRKNFMRRFARGCKECSIHECHPWADRCEFPKREDCAVDSLPNNQPFYTSACLPRRNGNCAWVTHKRSSPAAVPPPDDVSDDDESTNDVIVSPVEVEESVNVNASTGMAELPAVGDDAAVEDRK